MCIGTAARTRWPRSRRRRRAHRMDEVVGDVAAFAGPRERLGLQDVALVQLELVDRQAARAARAANEARGRRRRLRPGARRAPAR